MYKIAVLAGDGIGPEVTKSAIQVFQHVMQLYDQDYELFEGLIGGASIDAYGEPLSQETLDLCLTADAVFLGAIGGPKWDHVATDQRPEKGILRLRKELDVFANIRPLKLYPQLQAASPLKEEYLENVDFIVVRELTGGIYFGDKKRSQDSAIDVCIYTKKEIERICKVACEYAMGRKKHIVSVDKANVLETSRLWRETVQSYVGKHYPEITIEHSLVDSTAMRLITHPSDFDVILTENMFGDILSDEASVLSASLGLLPSASLGSSNPGLYEPVHGSAPDIAGEGIANPYAAILSIAMLCRQSLNLEDPAKLIETAVDRSIADGYLSKDLDADDYLSSQAITEAVIQKIDEIVELSTAKVGV